MKPVIYLRAASLLTLLHAVLHTIGGVFGKPDLPAEQTAVAAMKANQFPLMGATRSYWDFYIGIWAWHHDFSDSHCDRVVATQFAGEDRPLSPAADLYGVSGGIPVVCRELLCLFFPPAGDYGDGDRSLPGDGDLRFAAEAAELNQKRRG